MKDIFSLEGKNAIVIGGAGGIGQAIAKGLAFYGANVAIASRKLEGLQKAAQEIKDEVNKEIKIFQVDAGSEESIKELVENVVSDMGRVDILVNSQGLNLKHNALDFNMEDWDKVFNINVKGLMMCCKEFGKVMVKQNYGRIINVSSVRGARACGNGNAGYCSSKGAVDMMTRTLSFEFAPYNITVNAVAPTLTETPMMENFFNQNPQIKETLSKSHPLGRLGNPEDMIGPSVFLASEAANYVTGQIIYADGGLTAIG